MGTYEIRYQTCIYIIVKNCVKMINNMPKYILESNQIIQF